MPNDYLNILEEGRNKEFNFYPFDSFSDITLSGSGGFGNVYKAKYTAADMLVALKSYEKSYENSDLKEIVNELRIQKNVDIHQNIIRFLGVTKQEEICFNSIREKIVEGTPIIYLNIYQECWENDPDLRPTMDQVYDSLKKINLNSPVFQIASSSNISLPSTTLISNTNSTDIELCISGFLTNIVHQNNDSSIRYDDDDVSLNSQANELWNILVKSTNIGKEFAQISKEIIEFHKLKLRNIKILFDWLNIHSTNTNSNSILQSTNRLKEMSSSSLKSKRLIFRSMTK
ncbi:11839_t:CDS:2 [Gigaspora margarita]|uniref:11839_t:CDS:1 n=1 Tax=Gigaspora margarita TaxID=4874 RepID=A0ABM8W3N4_GIGMA|nr:11839_t:CDS:2 [Gigaspora margarita]